MNVVEPRKQINLVHACLILREKAFKDQDGAYFIVLDMQSGYFECSIKPSAKVDYDPMWVFNVKTCTLGIFDRDEMVEPVELEVIVKENE